MDVKSICIAAFVLIIVFCEALLDAGNVRLVDGTTNAEGRLEVFHDNVWGTVCDDGFDAKAAYVVCTMLGLPSSGAHPTYAYGRGSGTIWLDDVQCVGNETSLRSCSLKEWGEQNCGHHEDVGVVCVEATSVRVRLVDGSSPFDRIVELNVDNTWDTVCYSGFTYEEARLICRKLGMENVNSAFAGSVVRRQGVEPAKFRDIKCRGSETSIEQCYHSGLFTTSCDAKSIHSKVLGVVYMPDCLPIRNCKITGHSCDAENGTVCSQCEDNFQPTADHQQCELKQNSVLEFSESPAFISGWATASLLLVALIITCVVCRTRGGKTSGKTHLDKKKTDESPSELIIYKNQNTTETTLTTCPTYEIPEQSPLQQDDTYDVPDEIYDLPQN